MLHRRNEAHGNGRETFRRTGRKWPTVQSYFRVHSNCFIRYCRSCWFIDVLLICCSRTWKNFLPLWVCVIRFKSALRPPKTAKLLFQVRRTSMIPSNRKTSITYTQHRALMKKLWLKPVEGDSNRFLVYRIVIKSNGRFFKLFYHVLNELLKFEDWTGSKKILINLSN